MRLCSLGLLPGSLGFGVESTFSDLTVLRGATCRSGVGLIASGDGVPGGWKSDGASLSPF